MGGATFEWEERRWSFNKVRRGIDEEEIINIIIGIVQLFNKYYYYWHRARPLHFVSHHSATP